MSTMSFKSCKYEKRIEAATLYKSRQTESVNRWLARSTTRFLTISSLCNYDQPNSRLMQMMPEEILRLILAYATYPTARFEHLRDTEYNGGTPRSLVAYRMGFLELDSETTSYQSGTLRSVTVSREVTSLLGTCQKIRHEGLKELYGNSTLTLQPLALSVPDYILPGVLAARYVRKLHLFLKLPSSWSRLDIYGQHLASTRAFPYLLTAVDSLKLLPNLERVTFDMQIQFLRGLTEACHEDKQRYTKGAEAAPLCQLEYLPQYHRRRKGFQIATRLPRRYNSHVYAIMQINEPLKVVVNLKYSKKPGSYRSSSGRFPNCNVARRSKLEVNVSAVPHSCTGILCNVLETLKETSDALPDWPMDEYESWEPEERLWMRFKDPAWREHIAAIDLASHDHTVHICRPSRTEGAATRDVDVSPETMSMTDKAQNSLFAVGLRARSANDSQQRRPTTWRSHIA